MGLTNWDDIEERIDKALQTVTGEEFLIKPQKSRPNMPPIDDPSRATAAVCGIFTRQYRADDFNPSALSSKGLKFIDLAQRDPILEIVASDLPYEILQGDKLTRCKNGVEYEVVDPQANGHGILFIKLIERGISGNSP